MTQQLSRLSRFAHFMSATTVEGPREVGTVESIIYSWLVFDDSPVVGNILNLKVNGTPMTTMTFGPAIDEEQFLINIAFQLVDDFPALFDSVTYYSAAAHALVVKSQVNAVPVLTDIVITEGSSQPTGSATYNINATLGMTDLFIAGDRINLKIDGTPMTTVVYSVSHQDTQYAIGAQCATQFPTKIDYGNSDDDLHLTLIGEGKTVAFVVTDYTVTGA